RRGRIMDREKDAEQVLVTDAFRIERHLHDFGVPSTTGAHLAVRRVTGMPAGVPRHHVVHAVELEECGFEAPEAAAAQGRGFHDHRFLPRCSMPRAACAGSIAPAKLPPTGWIVHPRLDTMGSEHTDSERLPSLRR